MFRTSTAIAMGVLTACSGQQSRTWGPPPRGTGADAAVVADAAAVALRVDAGAMASGAGGPCVADARHCCMPDGRLVVPGGCQPDYPNGVQPATERADDGACRAIPC